MQTRHTTLSTNSCCCFLFFDLAGQWTLAHWRGQVNPAWRRGKKRWTDLSPKVAQTHFCQTSSQWEERNVSLSLSPSETLIIPLVSWINMCHVVHTVQSCSLSMRVSISTKASVNSDHTCMHHQYKKHKNIPALSRIFHPVVIFIHEMVCLIAMNSECVISWLIYIWRKKALITLRNKIPSGHFSSWREWDHTKISSSDIKVWIKSLGETSHQTFQITTKQ